jgi:hypothetical protein
MSALSIQPTFPIFTDIDGQPLEDGFIWIGQVNLDPQVNPINVYWDAALTLPAGQPIRTLAGYPSNSGTPARLYVNSDYSIRVMNKNGSVVYSAPAATERYGNLIDAATVDFSQAVTYPQGSVGEALQFTINVKNAPFNAVGDGVADDTAAIQAAVTSLPSGATLLFPPGAYKVTTPIAFAGKTNVTVSGYGATVYCGALRIESYFNIDGANGIDIFGFTFDAKMQSMPLYTPADFANVYNCGIYTNTGAQNITVRDCTFINLYTVAGFFRIATNVLVTDCYFTSPLQSQTQKMEHLLFQTSTAIKVLNCNFENAANTSPATNACGIFASGIRRFITIDNCTFSFCGRDNTGTHRLGVIDFYYDVSNVTVTNCVSRNTMAEFMRLSTCNNGFVSNNLVEMSQYCEVGSNTMALQSGAAFAPTNNTNCRNIIVSNNVFVNDFGVDIATCIGVFAYDWGAWTENVIIESNTSSNFQRMVTVQGPFNGVKIANNQSVSVTGGISAGRIELLQMPGIQSNYGAEANSFFNGLDIINNTISSRGLNGAIDLNLSAITTTAYVGAFNISGNTIDAILVLSGGIGINAYLISTTPTNTTLTVENNFVQRYNFGFQLRHCGNVVLANNKSQKNTNYLIQSNNLSFNAYGNITRNGLLFGQSKLTAGTVTVLGSDCNTGDNIMVSHYDNSGIALGHLYLTNIGNGVFDINSTSATDDSKVIWHVIH